MALVVYFAEEQGVAAVMDQECQEVQQRTVHS